MAPRKLVKDKNQIKITNFFNGQSSQEFYKSKLFNTVDVDIVSNAPQHDRSTEVTISQPIETAVVPAIEAPTIEFSSQPNINNNEIEKSNKKLVKLALDQSLKISKLKLELAESKANNKINAALNAEKSLSEVYPYLVKYSLCEESRNIGIKIIEGDNRPTQIHSAKAIKTVLLCKETDFTNEIEYN